jgi:hypothetical protein
MEDLGITDAEAEETRIMSRRYGLKFNFETDDGLVDDITMENLNASVTSAKVCFILLHDN